MNFCTWMHVNDNDNDGVLRGAGVTKHHVAVLGAEPMGAPLGPQSSLNQFLLVQVSGHFAGFCDCLHIQTPAIINVNLKAMEGEKRRLSSFFSHPCAPIESVACPRCVCRNCSVPSQTKSVSV